MVRENRIKNYTFPTHTFTGSNLSAVYSSFPINGTIVRVELGAGNHVSTGSVWVKESGTNATILQYNGTAAAGYNAYPVAHVVDVNNGGSGTGFFTNLVVNNLIYEAGSGFIAGSSLGPLTVYYI